MTSHMDALLKQTALTQLIKAERQYRKAADRAEELRQARNNWISNGLRRGLTHQQIADATGLSRGRISQIR